MPIDISEVSLTWHDERRGEQEYNPPMKKAEVRLYARVPEGEDGVVVLNYLSSLARAKVKDLLSGTAENTVVEPAQAGGAAAPTGEAQALARRTRGPNKTKDPETATGAEPADGAPAASEADTPASEPVEDEWASDGAAIEITDAELLAATSKRAGELGARDPIIKLISSFATRTDGAPFKVQEIPQAQRQDYLTKLAALTA